VSVPFSSPLLPLLPPLTPSPSGRGPPGEFRRRPCGRAPPRRPPLAVEPGFAADRVGGLRRGGRRRPFARASPRPTMRASSEESGGSVAGARRPTGRARAAGGWSCSPVLGGPRGSLHRRQLARSAAASRDPQ
jgi:hypothetical protein